MQNKGFVTTFAVLLMLVCLFYLSFSLVTRHYDNKAKEYANGDLKLENHYLDSMSTERVFLKLDFLSFISDKFKETGYTLKECREREIGLGLDLKGGMSVIVEVDVAAVLSSLGDTDNEAFNVALREAAEENRRGSSRDFITIFADKFKANNGADKLAGVFSTKLRDQIQPNDNDVKVVSVLRTELNSAAENSFNVLRTRIDRFGVVSPNIQKLDDRAERIMIEMPGITDPERVRKLLQGSANLEFWKTYNVGEIQNYLSSVDQRSREALSIQSGDSISADSLNVDFGFKKSLLDCFIEHRDPETGITSRFIGGSMVATVHRNDTATVGNILRRYAETYPSDLKFAWAFKANDLRETEYVLYSLKGDGVKKGPALEGDVVVDAKADQSQRGSAWEVGMQMNTSGTQRWANITGAEKGRSIAIVLDGHVYSAPNVNDKIEGGRSSITGNFTITDAKDLENVLKSGKMKAGVKIIQEDVVGPSLGEEAIDAGIISFILAIIVLMLYMCLAYGIIPGLVANAALILNLFFTMGTLAAFGAVMTLPGITGLILTLAMAVDANVLIYERTKEELRAGKNVKAALIDGYKHAFSAIFDSNLTSIITGIILFYFGTGAIKGFATTLIIGIAASFFTAVFLTRLFYETMIAKGKLRNLTFTTSITKNLFVNNKFNFLGLTKKIVIISVVFFLAGGISLATLKLNTGIDFTGGRNYIVRFDVPVTAGDVEKVLAPEFEGSNLRVITTGAGSQSSAAAQLRITTNYKIEDPSDEVEAEIRGKLSKALASYIPAGSSVDNLIQSSQRVGPSIADDLKTAATIAVIIAIICMGLYILFRFRDMAFSVGTLIAVAHDAIFVILIYSLLYKIMPFSMEIDQSFIAAVLTVIGYSINDKVVIFDRIRENRTLYPKRNITETINDSLNSTLGRTINTSLSSFLVILCIFALGGDTIRSFTFAIMVGIAVGTYSSLFIATPIAWKMLDKKQKKQGTVETVK
jgi:SecD/SecF fusion protein